MTRSTPLAVPVPSIEELQQNAARLLQQQLAASTQAAGPQALTAADLALARSNIAALAFVQAVGLHGAYRYLRDFIARQAIPVFSNGAFLDGWLDTYAMPRQPAAASSGTLAGTGVNGAVLPVGTLLQAGDGTQVRTTAAATVASGVITATVAALVEGAAGNLAAGTALTLVSPVVGIDAAFTATAALTGGSELESDDGALARLQQRLAAEPMGGSPADYARWALRVPGITRAWGVRNPGGPTTAGVIITSDIDGVAGLPTTEQRNAVYDYIRDPLRGPPDELFVIIPTLVPIDFTIHLSPDTTAIRNAVAVALRDVFWREAIPGNSIPQSHATEAISGVVGEYNHTISSPAITSGGFFTTTSFDRLLTLGTLTWA